MKGLEFPSPVINQKKRHFNEISNEEGGGEGDPIDCDAEEEGHKKKKLPGRQGGGAFLDVGSVSWSLLLATFFLALHDDRKSFYLTMDSIKEMLSVLKAEFKDFVPFEAEASALELYAADDLNRLKEN